MRSSPAARVKKSSKGSDIKFKIRCHRFVYTLVLKDSDKADKLKQSLPPCMFYPPLVNFPLWVEWGSYEAGKGIGRWDGELS